MQEKDNIFSKISNFFKKSSQEKDSSIKIGKKGEEDAVKYLKKNKYEILERNFRTKAGEIDIIAMKNDVVVFVEVKKRNNSSYGAGFDAVDLKKQQKIINAAQIYISFQKKEKKCRFDVISIDNKNINHIENAFGL